jgi:hypothetical protein
MTDEVQIFHCLQGRRPFMPTPPTLPASAQPATVSAAPLQSALEHHASAAIGLDNALDIDHIQRPTNARDRQLYRNIRKTHPLIADTLTLEAFVALRIKAQIVETVRDFLPVQTSLIGYLGETSIADAAIERVRETPAVYLEKLLTAPRSLALADKLLQALDWYGAHPGEQTSTVIRAQLLGKAIRLYLHAPSAEAPQEIAGFHWYQREHWGLSYQAIHARFETHLLTTKRVATATEAVLLARLYHTQLTPDFTLRDIPSDLPYRSSVVWVNFMHGALLSAAMPSSPPLTFQQTVDLPITLSQDASEEKLQAIALARLLPTLQWAITQGLIPEHEHSDYSPDEIEQAVKALDEHSAALHEAVLQLNRPTPDRLAMAKGEMAKLFGKRAFISDGVKLREERTGGGTGFRTPPDFERSAADNFTFLDLYATGRLANGKKWMISESDGKTIDVRYIRINDERKIQLYRDEHYPNTERPSLEFEADKPYIFAYAPLNKVLPDVEEAFEAAFKSHLPAIKNAYRILIISLLASLPLADRQAVEQGKIRVLSLRQATQDIRKEDETAKITLPLRARTGFVLEVSHRQAVYYYELLPLAGVIRRRPDVDVRMVGGVEGQILFDDWYFGTTSKATALRVRRLPFDWSAHATGTVPVANPRCYAILDQVGNTLPALTEAIIDLPRFSSSRQQEVADFIASDFLFQDEELMYAAALGRTRFDEIREEADRKLNFIKSFVPFWSSIEDLASGDKDRILGGLAGLAIDLASFLYPMGKFISGSARLIKVAVKVGRIGTRAALPSFSTLTRKLLVATLQNLNPLDGIPTLLKSALKGGAKLTVFLGKKAYGSVKKLTGTAGQYNLVDGLSHVAEPGLWKPLADGDQLATVKGINDVPVRNITTSGTPGYHLVDPRNARAYGPRLGTRANAVVPGRSVYNTLEKTDSHLIVEISQTSHVREVLEINGRTTMFIDDVPYRLDSDTLRRADLIDDQATFKKMSCRVRRMVEPDVCQTRYVTDGLAPTPPIGQFDESKGWAPWFGDSIYTPAGAYAPLKASAIARHDTLQASLLFQKGLFGRVKVDIPVPGQQLADTLAEGAILIERLDGSQHYIFTRLNAGDFYVADLLKGQKPSDTFTLRKATTLPDDLRNELSVVYTGSLNANNMARIHGIEAVERAMKTMDDIAIPIGGPANPPDTLTLLKVDTSPGEAVLFDHSTRIIVSKRAEGATTWSRSREAPEALRQRTAEIFDTLFATETINPILNSDLKIKATMSKLQNLLPPGLRTRKARNIAYAEVITAAGKQEVYVSVSGAQELTGYLPLFQPPFPRDKVIVNGTTYFNIDVDRLFPRSSMTVDPEGKLLAIPRTIENIKIYQPDMTRRPTSLDSEAKLISVIRQKYPDREMMQSVNIATTMPPCTSCSVVVKEFGYDGGANALDVLWK